MSYNKLKASLKLLPLLLAALFLAQCEQIFDIEPPLISFNLPSETGNYFGTVPVELEVSDNFGISKVELFSEGESIVEFAERPFETVLAVSDFSGTEVSLRAIAFDNAGNWAEVKQDLRMVVGVRVTAPNGGEMWDEQTSYLITWESSGSIGSSVRIDVSIDGGVSWNVVTSSTPNDGSYTWNTPSVSSDEVQTRIRVSSTNGSFADMSNSNFTIKNGGPTVSSPDPVDGATVFAGAAGQVLRVTSSDATGGVFWYDDDTQIDFSVSATKNGNFLEVTVPYVSGQMVNPGFNYWYIEATNAAGTTRYPTTGYFSFEVVPGPPTLLNPDPADGASVVAGSSGQLLRITHQGATSGVIYYDDDSQISFSTAATLNGNFLEATIPYVAGQMKDNGTNYWYVRATNSNGTTRYPATGNLSFTVTPGPPVVSNPDPADGASVTAGASGQLLRVTATNATGGTIYYDDDSQISFSTAASLNGNFLEATIPYTGAAGAGSMTNNGTNYWYVEATNAGGTTRYPATGQLSFTVASGPPTVSAPDPSDGATVSAGASGQLLRVTASTATSGVIWYDDDTLIDWSVAATKNGNFLEATIPYLNGQMNNPGTNYWFVQATNASGTTRYPASGYFTFTVAGAPAVSLPDPADGITVIPGAAGQLLRIQAPGATSGVIWYDDDVGFIDFSATATVNGNFLEATIPYTGAAGTGRMTDSGTNYWFVEATNSAGTTTYPAGATQSSGFLSFTVQEIWTSSNVPISIIDNSTVTSTVFIGASGTVNDVNVGLDITHTWDSDLDIVLQSPAGTRITLSSDNGGSSDNYTNTVFDDEASTAITSGFAPFTGTYRPEGLLSAFDGESVTGTWILEIFDDTAGDIGTLNSWYLDF